MTSGEVDAYARGVMGALTGRKDPTFTAMLIADVIALGDRVHGPAAIFGAPGTSDEVLVHVAGLSTLERSPPRPPEPHGDGEAVQQRYAAEHRRWAERDRRAGVMLDLHRKRVRAVLFAVADLEWLQCIHPDVARSMPASTGAALGALLEAFGASTCEARTSREISLYAQRWPADAERAREAPEAPWQDAGWALEDRGRS